MTERDLEQLKRAGVVLLRVYAGCLFSTSPWAGALVFAATAFAPSSCALGLLAMASALATAYALGLISERNPPTDYTYSALFLGLAANSTFAHPAAALAFAVLGASASALLTAGIRDLTSRFGLPSLALPFVLVYVCAVSAGRALALEWAVPVVQTPAFAKLLPAPLIVFFQALGAILCNLRVEVGALVLAALLVSSVHAAAIALLGFSVALCACLVLELPGLMSLAVVLNAMFCALGLGLGWATPSPRSYLLATLGAVLCALITPALAEPFGRLDLIPLSLPFTLCMYAVLLVARQHVPRSDAGRNAPAAAIAWR